MILCTHEPKNDFEGTNQHKKGFENTEQDENNSERTLPPKKKIKKDK